MANFLHQLVSPMHKYLLLPLVALYILACENTPSDTDGERIIDTTAVARIDSTLRSFVDSGAVAGASALICEKGEEVYFNAFGYADREDEVPIERNTIIQIFSMTKPITGVALMTLYEEGAFELDEPVAKYVPEFTDLKVFAGMDADSNLILVEPKRPLTIRDLTRHTSGFALQESPVLGPMVDSVDALNSNNTLSQMAEEMAKLPLLFHPGDQWYYGPSVDVQALVVERISGTPYDVYLREHVLDPLQMDETRYVVPAEDRDRWSALYRYQDGELMREPDVQALAYNSRDWPMKRGGGGLTSTIDDYARFARMLLNEGTLDGAPVLQPGTVRLMATNHLSDTITQRMWLPSKGQVGFGIDFAVRLAPPATDDENRGVVGEFFWDGAATTLFWVDPANDLTAILFVQVIPFQGRLHRDFRAAVYGAG
jgi:CubicO group peptidase (beta-lactamase class C family)